MGVVSRNDTKKARALQALTGWSYSECVRASSDLTVEAVAALIKMRGGNLNMGLSIGNRGRQYVEEILKAGGWAL